MPKPTFLFRTDHVVISVHGTSSHWNWLYDAGLGLGLGQPVFTHPASMPKASHMTRTSCSSFAQLSIICSPITWAVAIQTKTLQSHTKWILANNLILRHWPPWLPTPSICLQTTLVNAVDVSVSLFRNKENLQFLFQNYESLQIFFNIPLPSSWFASYFEI